MRATALRSILCLSLAACQLSRAPAVLELPSTSFSLAQRIGYGQPFPAMDVVLKNPYAETICVPASSFDDAAGAIGVRQGNSVLTKKTIADVFPPEGSTRLHGDA